MSVSEPRDLALRFRKLHKLTLIASEHRRNGRHINRHDYYEFIDPSAPDSPRRRRLTEEQISIIAADIEIPAHIARQDYLARGGELQKQRGAA